jgi:hypothetical protein
MNEEIKTELKEFLEDGNYSQEEQESLTLSIDSVLLNEPSERDNLVFIQQKESHK